MVLIPGLLQAQNNEIPFEALQANHQGTAAWNADGTGSEAEKTGHTVTWTNCVSVAYYYLASLDYDDIDADATAAAFVGKGNISGFANFTQALSDNGFAIGDITMKFSIQTLGADQENADWDYDANTTTEKRHYSGGEYVIYLRGSKMVGGKTPIQHMTIDYNDLSVNGCFDDEIAGNSEYTIPSDSSKFSPAAVQACAAAFLTDIGAYGMRFVYTSIQAAGQEEFVANSRTGAYFQAPSGKIEKGIVAMPVELSTFSAISQSDAVDLIWRTETELDNYGFEIERANSSSKGEKFWEKIGFISGHGNSSTPLKYNFIDQTPEGGTNYYRLKQIDFDGRYEYSYVVSANIGAPEKIALEQNYPNPFNPTTSIKFSLPQQAIVSLKIVIALGEIVNVPIDNKMMQAGFYNIQFTSENLSSGLYIYQLRVGEFISAKKMILLR